MSAPDASFASAEFDLLDLIPPEDQLRRIQEKRQAEYASNQPFPHIVLEDFLDPGIAHSMLRAFPAPNAGFWSENDLPQEKKLFVTDERRIPAPIRNVLYGLNGARFLHFLENLTGIQGLIPDPYLLGGGMHQIVPGGRLEVHADFNRYPRLKLHRCLNLLLFLNEDWKEDYGGHLELWDGQKCVRRILPVFNRCVVFTTTATSYHGHPEPLACPPERSRKSVALYYYTAERPRDQEAFGHGTSWLRKREADSRAARLRAATRRLAHEITPPVLNRFAKRALAALGFEQ